jgi:putative ABC transport system permease protein
MPITGDIWNNQQALKDELKQNSLTRDFTITSDLPTNLANATGADWNGKDPHLNIAIPLMAVNEDFTHVFRMKLLAGRSFSGSAIADSVNYMINEKMVSVMGLNAATAIGKSLTLWVLKVL